MSKEEYDHRVAEGLCFRCGKSGHRAKDCPTEQTMAATESSKPSGMVNLHSMGLGGVLRDLQALVDTTKQNDTLTLASAWIVEGWKSEDKGTFQVTGPDPIVTVVNANENHGIDKDGEDDIPFHHLGQMGDPLACQAEYILCQGCPFPGNEPSLPEPPVKDRFCVYRTSATQHVIWDNHCLLDQESDMLIDSELLMNSEVNLGHWYTKHLVCLGYGTREKLQGIACFAPMTTLLASRVQDLLSETFNSNWKTSGDLYQFTCITKKDRIMIWDCFTHFRSFLPYGLALWEYFDMVNWYQTAIHRVDGPTWSTWKDPDQAWRIPSWLFTGNMDSGGSMTVKTSDHDSINSLDLFGAQIPKSTYPALECNVGTVKDFKRMVPKAVVVVVHINGHPV